MGETFISYDGPKMFTAHSLTDQAYLALMVQEDSDEDVWLYLPVSKSRLVMIRSGGVTLNEAFRRAEGIVYEVHLPYSGSQNASASPVTALSLLEEWLPLAGLGLDLPTNTLPAAKSDNEIELLAHQEIRTRLRIEVELSGVLRDEAPTRKIAELLLATQDVYDNIGLTVLERTVAPRKRIPLDVIQQMQSEVVGLAAASFMIELASTTLDYVTGKSTFAKVTETLLTLLDPALRTESLIEELKTLQLRGAKSFRNFVDGLVKTEGDVSIVGAGMSFAVIRRDLPQEGLQSLKNILHKLVPDNGYEIKGRMRLFSGNVDNRKFGLNDQSQDKFYKGDVSEAASRELDHAELGELYDVVISVKSSSDEAMGEKLPTYTLEQLSEATGVAKPTTITEITE